MMFSRFQQLSTPDFLALNAYEQQIADWNQPPTKIGGRKLFGIKKLGLIYKHQFYIETQKSHLLSCALHGHYAESPRKSGVFHNRRQRDKTSRTG